MSCQCYFCNPMMKSRPETPPKCQLTPKEKILRQQKLRNQEAMEYSKPDPVSDARHTAHREEILAKRKAMLAPTLVAVSSAKVESKDDGLLDIKIPSEMEDREVDLKDKDPEEIIISQLPNVGKALFLYDSNSFSKVATPNVISKTIARGLATKEIKDLKVSENEAEQFNGRVIILLHGFPYPKRGVAAPSVNRTALRAVEMKNLILETFRKTTHLKSKITHVDLIACHIGSYDNGKYMKDFATKIRSEIPEIQVRGANGTFVTQADRNELAVNLQNYVKIPKGQAKGQVVMSVTRDDFIITGKTGSKISGPTTTEYRALSKEDKKAVKLF